MNGFEYFMSVFVALNALIMVLKWPNMPKTVQSTVDTISYFCTCIFILEAALKLTAYG